MPEVSGLTSREAVELARGLADLPLGGFGQVEGVAPYDLSDISALLAANLIYDPLFLLAAP